MGLEWAEIHFHWPFSLSHTSVARPLSVYCFQIYVGINALKPGAHSRTKEDSQTIRHVYLHIDHDGPVARARPRQGNLVLDAAHVESFIEPTDDKLPELSI
jgi:hypothetical protein